MKLRATTLLIAVLGSGGVLAAGPQRARNTPKHPSAPADATVIYRCTDANGMLSIQNGIPCPKGQRSERQVIARPAAVVAPVAPPPVAAPAAAPPPESTLPATVVEGARDLGPLPPPPLYRCRTQQDGAIYLSETDTPPPRCRPIPMVNASSKPEIPDPAMQNQCVMEQDLCERIPDSQVCPAWQQQLLQAQAMVELGNPELLEKATSLRDRAQRVFEQACNGSKK